MAGWELIGPLGARAPGKVTGLTYEQAAASRVLGPLGMSQIFSRPMCHDPVLRRGAQPRRGRHPVDHVALATPAQTTPGWGVVSSVADEPRCACFHLGDSRAETPYDPARASEAVGTYENDFWTLTIAAVQTELSLGATSNPGSVRHPALSCPRPPAGRSRPAAPRRGHRHTGGLTG